MWENVINEQIAALEEEYIENARLCLFDNCDRISAGISELRQLVVCIEKLLAYIEGD